MNERSKMDAPLEYNPALNRKRWVAYFDLLGTKDLIKAGDYAQVFDAYSDALLELKQEQLPELYRISEVYPIWFSDTFCVFMDGDIPNGFAPSPYGIGPGLDDSNIGFSPINSIACELMYWLTVKRIPVRGAIAYGECYVDRKHQLFFGEALLEAHHYGECQDWLGLILTPSAETRLREVDLDPAEKLSDYARCTVPFKDGSSKELFACLFAGNQEPDHEICLQRLGEMKATVAKTPDSPERARILTKYVRTLEFLNGDIHSIVQNH